MALSRSGFRRRVGSADFCLLLEVSLPLDFRPSPRWGEVRKFLFPVSPPPILPPPGPELYSSVRLVIPFQLPETENVDPPDTFFSRFLLFFFRTSRGLASAHFCGLHVDGPFLHRPSYCRSAPHGREKRLYEGRLPVLITRLDWCSQRRDFAPFPYWTGFPCLSFFSRRWSP